MKIYRTNGFVVLEDVGSYLVNQLQAESLTNKTRISQIGVTKNDLFIEWFDVLDENGVQVASTQSEAFSYIESIIYGSPASDVSKTATVNFTPPAAHFHKATVVDVDALEGQTFIFLQKYNDGEAEWNALVVNAYCFIDGEIDLSVHAPTGLFVGEYEFEYKVL